MNNAVEASINPFSNSQVAARPTASNAVAQSDQQRTIAEVQAAMMIARMNPRNQIDAMDRILNACTRPTLAESAIYQYSRGGNDISGPSIRLAETIAQGWGNLQFGIRELEQRNGESTVQAFAWDVEANTRREVTFQVPHVRYTKNGGAKRLEDPRDIYETVANQGSRRLRACILAVVPGDVTEAAVAQCELTLETKADTSPEAMQRMVAAFDKFGVTKEQIEKRIQRRLDAIHPAQIISLRKIHTSLKDGMSAPSDWFEAVEPVGVNSPSSRTEEVKEKLRSNNFNGMAIQVPHSPSVQQLNPAEKPRWPEPITDQETGEQNWTDAAGTFYDSTIHGWNAVEKRPSVSQDGKFRAKRGTAQPTNNGNGTSTQANPKTAISNSTDLGDLE
ncbi:hypothetical protein CCP3SC15_4340001 [Gammaproteobacteria bacterium]